MLRRLPQMFNLRPGSAHAGCGVVAEYADTAAARSLNVIRMAVVAAAASQNLSAPVFVPAVPFWCRGRSDHTLALLWQIYSRCVLAQICFRQCGHRCGGGRAMSATMA